MFCKSLFGHCIACPSIYSFWLSLWYLSFVYNNKNTSMYYWLLFTSDQSFYHWGDTSAGGLLVPEGIIHPVVRVSITGVIPLLVDY
jgi:hypothetical protein